MPKAELGEKQVCPSCGAKFYDLAKRPAVCPKCQTAFDPSEETVKPKRTKARAPAFAPGYEEEGEAEAEAEEGAEEAEDEEDAEGVEDAPELDEAVEEPIDAGEDEDGTVEGRATGDELPPGFSEDDEDLVDEELVEGDDDVLLEDDADEAFDDDALPEADDGDKEKDV